MKSGKIWGETVSIFSHNNTSIHRIQIIKGSSCSKHYHQHKYNRFFIESGKLMIEIWQKDYDLVDKTILEAGESLDVHPGLFHRFLALENTIAYEIYYLTIEENDIIRETCGKTNE